MKKLTKHYKRMRYVYIKSALLIIVLNIIFLPSWVSYHKDEANLFHVFLNGEDMGYLGDAEDIDSLLRDARREVAAGSDGIVYAKADITYEASSVIFAEVDDRKTVTGRMVENLKKVKADPGAYSASSKGEYVHAYTVKIGDYIANIENYDDVTGVLQAALDVYQQRTEYVAMLTQDPLRELNVLTATVVAAEEADETENIEPVKNAGFDKFIEDSLEDENEENADKDFEDFDYGLMSMSFGDNIEVVDSYLNKSQLKTKEQVIQDVVEVKEVNTVYEVVEGDTLSGIAIKTNIPMDKIIELNDTLENENSMIRPGDELIVTTVEPPLTVNRSVREYVEEIYDAEIEYIYNDDWYTTDKETLRQPSAGRRNIVAETYYSNDKKLDRVILKEELVMEAVAKKVEMGTKIPPTYIKPLAGGRLSSGFGGRKRPTKGASSYHQGVDWATPVGTAILASCGGTVTRAGWGKGYGYCVYIKHPDGRETRYGHLSKVLVSVGQTVSQGQKIALSGNTGVSTGPHLHFEIRIGGAAVNPLKYLN